MFRVIFLYYLLSAMFMSYSEQFAENVATQFREILAEGLDIYDAVQSVDAFPIRGDRLYVGYSAAVINGSAHQFGTVIEANIEGPVCFVLHLGRAEPYRGKGYGRQMYLCLEELVRRLRCKTINVSAAGSRPAYFESLGFTKKFPDDPNSIEYEKDLQ